MLGTVRTLIVDEIHAVVSNRRGSHLALSMERLAALVNGPLQRIGLSATQKPIEEVGRFLVGGCSPRKEVRSGPMETIDQSLPTNGEVGRDVPIAPNSHADHPERRDGDIAPYRTVHSPHAAPLGGRILLASAATTWERQPPCTIIDAGHKRQLDLAIELPGSPL